MGPVAILGGLPGKIVNLRKPASSCGTCPASRSISTSSAPTTNRVGTRPSVSISELLGSIEAGLSELGFSSETGSRSQDDEVKLFVERDRAQIKVEVR